MMISGARLFYRYCIGNLKMLLIFIQASAFEPGNVYLNPKSPYVDSYDLKLWPY